MPGMDRRRFLGAVAATVLLRPGVAAARPSRLAVATCDDEKRLSVVDVGAGRLVHSIPCPADPRSVERLAGGDVLVCHTSIGAVSIVDGTSLSVKHLLRDFTEPRYTAAHPSGRYAFVTDSGTRELVSVDLELGRTLGRVRLEGWARHVTTDPAGATLWVGLGSASERIAVVDVGDPARPRLVRTLQPPFLAHDVGFEPSGGRVWVTSGAEGELAVYDTAHRLRLRLPAGAPPQHVTFAGDAAYVTSGDDGTVQVLSVHDGRPLRTTRVPVGSYNVQARHGLVLTPSLDTGSLCVLDRGGALVHELEVAGASHDACFIG
jgi:DNA-binding beta-propeller fold protein YncE